jgi:hypothetical protein
VRRLRQEEDEAGSQYVLQLVPEAHRDAHVRPEEPPPQPVVTVDPHMLRPGRSGTTEASSNPYARTYKRALRTN